jgi:fatty-acyl-CoA synthase
MTKTPLPTRSQLYSDPEGKFVHDVVLDACRLHGDKLAMVDTSCAPYRSISYAEYGDLVERAARGLVAAGIRPGEMIGIYLTNCWEFGVAFHAATLAGAIPTTMNPTYREREVHYHLNPAHSDL